MGCTGCCTCSCGLRRRVGVRVCRGRTEGGFCCMAACSRLGCWDWRSRLRKSKNRRGSGCCGVETAGQERRGRATTTTGSPEHCRAAGREGSSGCYRKSCGESRAGRRWRDDSERLHRRATRTAAKGAVSTRGWPRSQGKETVVGKDVVAVTARTRFTAGRPIGGEGACSG